jgi:hypothetical protein
MGLGTGLAAIALAVAVAAMAVNFVVPGPKGPAGEQGPAGAGGSTGSPGAQGPTGPQGPPAVEFWADVNAAGSLIHGSQATGAEESATGEYQVNFTQDVAGCSFLATLVVQDSEDIQGPGYVTVAAMAHVPDAVFVATNTTSGTAESLPFDLVVLCTADLWAVVSSTGSLARGADVSLVHQNATGEYTVDFDQDVTNCSFFATLGGTGPSPGVPAGGVTVQGEPYTPDGVVIATQNAAGASTSSSFHLAAVCNLPDWAVISTTGSIVRGTATSAANPGTGAYQIGFAQDVANCAYIATPGETGSTGVYPAAIVTLAPQLDTPTGIYVSAYNPAGTSTAESFHIAAFC